MACGEKSKKHGKMSSEIRSWTHMPESRPMLATALARVLACCAFPLNSGFCHESGRSELDHPKVKHLSYALCSRHSGRAETCRLFFSQSCGSGDTEE